MRPARTARALRLCLVVVAVLAAWSSAAAARPLEVGLVDPVEPVFAEADPAGAYAAARGANMRVIRVPLAWSGVAPQQPANAADPRDPAYRWGPVDARLARIVAAGLEPLVTVYSAPTWGRVQGRSPDPAAFGAFMAAVAARYDGAVPGAPRVRLWHLWNEPNLKSYLDPADPAERYRAMVNAAYPAVKAVRADNVVVAGGTGPFGGKDGRYGVAPLAFMRDMLRERVRFDVWSHHPYTSGPPARSAAAKDDASIGDLPEIRRILRSTGHGNPPIWATEFSWDSGPPDPFAVPLREHARWVSEGLYRMWRQNVQLVVWFQLRDNPRGSFSWGQTFQSGLYFRTTPRYSDERAKPALHAIRFPFVALPEGRRVVLWGRRPRGDRGQVVVERRSGGRWRRVASLRADRDGIFRGSLRPRGVAPLRARAAGTTSLPFVPRKTRNRFVNPFGGTSLP